MLSLTKPPGRSTLPTDAMPSDKSSEKSSHVDPPASVIDQSRRTGAAPLGHPITPISPTSSSSITNDDSHLSPQPISSTSHASRPQSVQSLSSTISHASSSSVSLPTTVSPGRTRRPSDDSLATDTTSELETGIEGVAPKRQIEFERNFAETIRQSNQSDDVDAIRVVMTRAADLQRKLLIHGRLYLTKTHLCFHSNILGIKTDNTLVLKDIISIEKGTTGGRRNAMIMGVYWIGMGFTTSWWSFGRLRRLNGMTYSLDKARLRTFWRATSLRLRL